LPLRRRLLPLILALGAALLGPAPAGADTRGKWDGISSRIAGAMQALQRPDGSFEDYLSTKEPYAEAMVGYGLLLRGVRTGDRACIDAGLRAVSQTVDPGARGGPMLGSVFKQFAVASAYRLASERLAGDPGFEPRREAWAAWLRQVRPVLLAPARGGASNKHLVEAVADLELVRSGVTGGAPGTVAADPAGALARVREVVGERWPAVVAQQLRDGPLGPMAVASDAPAHPLAYHGLSLGMLDRALTLLGADAPAAAHAARRAMARASWTLVAPDGDVAYWGRSQQQSWALALTAAGADGLDRPAPAGGVASDVLRRRLAVRLDRVHGFGPYGVWIVPALREHLDDGRAGIDDYAGNGVYNGLTIVGAEWTMADLTGGESSGPGPRPPGDRDGAWLVGRAQAAFAIARRGDLWYAVRKRGGLGGRFGDPRYAFGLMTAKRRVAGVWRDVVATAPRAVGAGDAAGPWLVLRDGTLAEAYGNHIATRPGGVVIVRGGFRSSGGAVVRRGVRFTYVPTPTGVSVSFQVRASDELELADFRGPDAAPAGLDLSLVRRGGRRSRPVAAAVTVRPGFASATQGPLVRVAARVRPRRAGTLTWTPR
jgi:hypothetical protein